VQIALQALLVGLWVGVIPALLAGLVLRYLVPPVGTGALGIVVVLGHRFGLYFGVALYLLFTGLARYWRYRLPGGRYASTLPAQLVPDETDGERLAMWADHAALYAELRSDGMRRRLGGALAELDEKLAAFRAALESGDLAAAGQARRALEAIAAPALAWHRRRETVRWVATIATAAVVAVLFRARVAEPYNVLSGSMLPTLEPDDRVAGNKLAYRSGSAPRRGDVVVFRSAAVALAAGAVGLPDVLVKRVIGLPGDRVAMHGSTPVINGWTVPTCDAGDYMYLPADASGGVVHGRLVVEFLDDRAYLSVHTAAIAFPDPYVVKPGEVFVLGDNRGNSLDSRAYNQGQGGGVPLAAVEARVQWFLVGTHRSGDVDAGRLLRPIDGLQTRLRLEGIETQSLDDGIARCLKSRPSNTSPPPSFPSAGVPAAGHGQRT
jgi:signal peptidase I